MADRTRGALALSSILPVLAFAIAATSSDEDISMGTAIPSALAAKTLLLDAARAGGRVIAVGAWGHVVLSDDEGQTWRDADRVATRSVLTGVCFADEQWGWAVGHDGVVLNTRDRGETWTRQRAEPDEEMPLFSVSCFDRSHASAVGAYGLALRTADGGVTWERFQIGEAGADLHLNELFEGRDGTQYVAAEAGTVYRSRDRGATWETLETPYDGSFWGGLGLEGGGLLVFGLRGTILRSDDRGETWTRIESRTDQSLGGGTVLADGTIVLGGLGGAFARSDDLGHGFRAGTRPSRRGSRAVLESRAGGVLFFGEGGVERLPRLEDPGS